MRIAGLTLLLLAGCSTVTDPASLRELPRYQAPDLGDAAALRVIALGDFGTGRSSQREVAEAMAIRARAEGVDFVLGLGDNFYPDGVSSVDDPQWEEKFEAIYSDPALVDLPWYMSLGNHDHKGSIEAQLDYGRLHPKRWIQPERYYAFTRQLSDGTTVAFFMLDTTPLIGEPEQVAWLAQELATRKADWKVVCGHQPIYSSCVKPFRGPNTQMIEPLTPLFREHEVDLYVAGHDHILELTKPREEVHYVISGAGAGRDKAYAAEWTESSHYVATGGGFVYFVFTADRLLVEFVRLDGQTQFGHQLSPRSAASSE